MVSRQKYFFPADHSTMLTSKALHIPLSNNTISMQYFKLKKTPKKQKKRQSCEEIPFMFLFHQYWNNNNKTTQNQNCHILVNPQIHVQGQVQIQQDTRALGLPNSAGL